MNALLNGMNDRQAEAVQNDRRSLVNHGRGWLWEDSSFDPPYRLSD